MTEYVPLGDIVDIKGGGTPDKKVAAYWGGDIPWASVKDFKSGTLDQTVDRITKAGVAASATNIIPAGHIIVPTRMAVGKAAINTIDMAINQDLKALFPKELVDTRYLYNVLLASSGTLLEQATGATVKGIKLDVLRSLKIPLPPLEEQRRIAGILDQADALRRLRNRALDKLNTLGQAIFHEMFVANAQNGWPEVAVNEVVENARTGPFGSQMLVSEFVDEGIPVLGIDNVVTNAFTWAKERYITEKKYAELERYTVLPGDVLITIMGTCGRVAVVPDDIPKAINTKHVCCMTLDREVIEPVFLQAAFLHHPDVLKQLGVQAKGAVMPGLNMGIIKGLKLSLPPLELQQKFALQSLEASSEGLKHKMALDNVGALFASLQHRAFRGEL